MSTPPEPAFIVSSIAAAVTAILTIAQAVPSIDKRLARVRDIEREIGLMPPLVRRLYVCPQEAYKWVLLVVSAIGIAMVFGFMYGIFRPGELGQPTVEAIKYGAVGVVAIWLVIGVAIQTNFPSRFLAKALEWSRVYPIRELLKAATPWNRNPSWAALQSLIALNENAKPIFPNAENAKSLADWLVRNAPNHLPPHRATPPMRPGTLPEEQFRQRIGNALLAGCIIEEAHYRLIGFPRRKWGSFYQAIGQLATQSDLLSAATLNERCTQDQFYDELLADLNQRLEQLPAAPTNVQQAAQTTVTAAQAVQQVAGQAAVDAKALQTALQDAQEAMQALQTAVQAAQQDRVPVPASDELRQKLREAFSALVRDYQGSAAALDPRTDGWVKTRFEIISHRVAQLKAFDDEGMRVQFVKLANVWNVWPHLAVVEFSFPFAVKIAALLLDRGVIMAAEDVKAVAFDDAEDRQVARAAEKMVVDHAIKLIEPNIAAHQHWLPAQCANTRDVQLRWWLAYEFDLRLWDYASRVHNGAELPNDDPGLTRWKAALGQVARVKK